MLFFTNVFPLKNINSPLTICNHKNQLINNDDIKALNVGLSLDLLSKINNDIVNGYNIIEPKIYALEMLFGYYTYGLDRYNDKELNDYKKYFYDFTLIFIVSLLCSNEDFLNVFPISSCLYLTKHYKKMKPFLGIYKPIYIGMMWTLAVSILPNVIHDDNYKILLHPIKYFPNFLLMVSTSNLKDIKDIKDDKKNNINTFPVIYGKRNTELISYLFIIISLLMYYYNYTSSHTSHTLALSLTNTGISSL